jgi:glycosyltransferase involved in cell wall biosynthesis
MKIGLVLSAPGRSVSVRQVMASVRDALAGDHELVYLHPSIAFAPEEEQYRIAGEFVAACDAIVGLIHPAVLAMRQRMGRRVPYLLLMLGTMPRGAFRFGEHVPRLTADDLLLVNCEADRELCTRFFPNARVALVPLAYDDRSFHPLDAAERPAIREALGFDEDARIILYAGRVIPEKNLHTVLRVVRLLLNESPDLHLVLAGRIESLPFTEFGVTPTNFAQTLAISARRLGIPEDRVLCTGPVPPAELRELYGVADVSINLTLHHDENFGLSQVEAMACGSPVVGSMWGGLKDTIADGVTGYRVSTVPTPLGVRVDWWEAANRVSQLLRDPGAAERARHEGPRRASQHFSQARLKERLGEVVREHGGVRPGGEAEPLLVSDFATELWATCDPASEVRAPFRRGPRSFELYRELVTPYSGLSELAVPADAPLEDDQLLYLGVPVAGDPRAGFWLDDPLFPLECPVPSRSVQPFRKLLESFAAEPVMTTERLGCRHLLRSPAAMGALAWMIESGLVLRSRLLAGGIDPSRVPREVGLPLFTFERLPPLGVDFVVSG